MNKKLQILNLLSGKIAKGVLSAACMLAMPFACTAGHWQPAYTSAEGTTSAYLDVSGDDRATFWAQQSAATAGTLMDGLEMWSIVTVGVSNAAIYLGQDNGYGGGRSVYTEGFAAAPDGQWTYVFDGGTNEAVPQQVTIDINGEISGEVRVRTLKEGCDPDPTIMYNLGGQALVYCLPGEYSSMDIYINGGSTNGTSGEYFEMYPDYPSPYPSQVWETFNDTLQILATSFLHHIVYEMSIDAEIVRYPSGQTLSLNGAYADAMVSADMVYLANTTSPQVTCFSEAHANISADIKSTIRN